MLKFSCVLCIKKQAKHNKPAWKGFEINKLMLIQFQDALLLKTVSHLWNCMGIRPLQPALPLLTL